MNSIKCPECGLVNFATATECKRCHHSFQQSAPITESAPLVRETPPEAPPEPRPEARYEAPIEALPEAAPDALPPNVPPPPLPEYFDAEPVPFSKPVILFAVGMGLSILIVGYELILALRFMNSYAYESMAYPGMGPYYLPSLEPLMYMEVLIKVTELVGQVVLLVLLMRKAWAFLKWIPRFLVAVLIFEAIEIAATISLRAAFSKFLDKPPSALTEVQWAAGLILGAAAILVILSWLAYFNTSKEVKKIFIN